MSFSRVSAVSLRAAGFVGAMRYLVGVGKALSKVELAANMAVPGFGTGFVHEGAGQQGLRGYQGGLEDGRAANHAADVLGVPKSRPITYAAVDPTPVPQAQWVVEADYFRGVRDAGGRPRHVYGPGNLVTWLGAQGLVTGGWEVSSWPGAGSRYSVLRQMANGIPRMPTFGGAIDHNLALAGDWGQHPAPTPLVPTEEESLNPTDNVAVWVVPGTGGATRFELHRDGGLYTYGGADPTALRYTAYSNVPAEEYDFPDPTTPGVFSFPGLVNAGRTQSGWPERFFTAMHVIAYEGINYEIMVGTAGPAGPTGPKGETGPAGPQGPVGDVGDLSDAVKDDIAALDRDVHGS